LSYPTAIHSEQATEAAILLCYNRSAETDYRAAKVSQRQRLASGFESDLTVTVSTVFLFSQTGPFEQIPRSQLLFQD
jgi:hypothetical protein